MSRLQAGALQLVLRDVGLEEVVGARARRACGDRAGAGRASTCPRRCPRVHADAGAARAGGREPRRQRAARGRRRTSRCASRRARCSDRVDLRVIDHGPGIPPADRERIFQPFQRLGDNPANGTGVGLGLAVARGFVEAMGGELAVEDTPGGGSTMVFSLPGGATR